MDHPEDNSHNTDTRSGTKALKLHSRSYLFFNGVPYAFR